MREVMARLGEDIQLGRRGENLATCVTFDVSEWLKEGEGSVHLLHQRNGDDHPYPCAITVEGGVATWVITESDVAVAGRGKAELQYLEGDVCVKSDTYYTNTLRALGKAGEVPPAPEEGWVRKVLKAGRSAFESAEATQISETNAKQSEAVATQAATAAADSYAGALVSEANAKASEDAAGAARAAAEKARDEVVRRLSEETWFFELEDGSTVSKQVVVV